MIVSVAFRYAYSALTKLYWFMNIYVKVHNNNKPTIGYQQTFMDVFINFSYIVLADWVGLTQLLNFSIWSRDQHCQYQMLKLSLWINKSVSVEQTHCEHIPIIRFQIPHKIR